MSKKLEASSAPDARASGLPLPGFLLNHSAAHVKCLENRHAIVLGEIDL